MGKQGASPRIILSYLDVEHVFGICRSKRRRGRGPFAGTTSRTSYQSIIIIIAIPCPTLQRAKSESEPIDGVLPAVSMLRDVRPPRGAGVGNSEGSCHIAFREHVRRAGTRVSNRYVASNTQPDLFIFAQLSFSLSLGTRHRCPRSASGYRHHAPWRPLFAVIVG